MTVNALFFVDRLRSRHCITLIDALQSAYGPVWGALVYLPSCLGDVCWAAAVLSALGSSISAMLGVPQAPAIVVSAAVAVAYTLAGGMAAGRGKEIL